MAYTDPEVEALSQSLTDRLDENSIRISTAQSDALSAYDRASEAITDIYETGLSAGSYTDKEVEDLRVSLMGIIDRLAQTVDSHVATTNQTFDQILGDVDARVSKAVTDTQTIADGMDKAGFEATTNQLLNTVLPQYRSETEAAQNTADQALGVVNSAFTGFSYESVSEGLDAAISKSTDALKPVGYSVLRPPAGIWTIVPSAASQSSMVPPSLSDFVSDDPILGEAYGFPAGDRRIAQAYPRVFDPSKVYKVNVRGRVIDNGTSGAGITIEIGATTWGPGGQVQVDVETGNALFVKESEGEFSFYAYLTGNSGFLPRLDGKNKIDLTGSANANQVFIYTRQNSGGTPDGLSLLSLLEVEDVTEAFISTSSSYDVIDTTPPGVPTGLDVTSTIQPDGKARVVAVWDLDANDDTASYDLEITENGGGAVGIVTRFARWEWTTLPGTVVSARVRALDRFDNGSDYCTPYVHTAAKDTTPPAVPTWDTVLEGFDTLWLKWNGVLDTDLHHYEIVEKTGTTTPGPNPALLASAFGTAFVRSGLGRNQTRYYWIRAVDTSGNKSGWSAIKSGTTGGEAGLTNEDIRGILDATSFADGIEPVKILQTVPATKQTSFISVNGQFYRWENGKYTKEVAADQVVGKLTANQIAAAAIGVGQLAAGAVRSDKLAIGNFTNFAGGNDFTAQWPVENTSGYILATYDGDPAMTIIGAAPTLNCERIVPVKAGEKFYLGAEFQLESAWNGTMSGSKLRLVDQNNNFITALGWGADEYSFLEARLSVDKEVTIPAGVSKLKISIVNDATEGRLRIFRLDLVRKTGGVLIEDGAISADKIKTDEAVITGSAQIANAVIDTAHVRELNAEILKGGTTISRSVLVDGSGIGAIKDRANDPASRVNEGTTRIDPGRILISGATTLSDWRGGGDSTKINGGALEANSVTTNSLQVGQRGIKLSGIDFEPDSPSADRVSWTSGQIRYTDDDGSEKSVSINSGSTAWTGGVIWIYWVKGQTILRASTTQTGAKGADTVVLATYEGGSKLDNTYGRTIITDDFVKTGSLTARVVKARSMTSDIMAVGTLTAEEIEAEGISKPAIVGDSSVYQSGGTWTELGRATAIMPRTSFVQGGLAGSLSHKPSEFPSSFAFRVLVGGAEVLRINNSSESFMSDDDRFFFRPFSKQGQNAGTVNVILQGINMGGKGFNTYNLYAQMHMR